jgi:hypothetical protein
VSNKRRILKFAVCGAGIGALILFFFGEGLAMALYLAVEGAILGFVIGGVVGMIMLLLLGALPKKRDLPHNALFR